MSEEDLKDKELVFSYNLTAGKFLVKKRRFKEAIESFSRALQLTPNHETCLTMRSKCYLLLGQHDKALKDSEDALANNPTSGVGIIQKAEALYAQGEFEYALVCFQRGKKMRPDIEEFNLGVQKSAEAIENSIGDKSGLRFCRMGKILRQIQSKKEKETQASTWRGQKRKQSPTEEDSAKKNYGCKTLLEELSKDKAFLQKLIHHPELTGPCKEEIVKEATEVLEFMQTRQEFWGQQKPLYARKIQRKMAEGKTTVDDEDEQLRRRIDDKKSRVQTNHETVTRLLVDIDGALQRAEYERALQMCAEAEHTIKSYSLTWLPRRQAYLGVVYSALGDAHLKLGHYREALRWHNKDLELSKDNPRLLHSRARALDNLGRTHATFRRYQAAIDAWEQRIPLSRSPEKRTWLFHEIGTCYRELGRHETARFYGTKCVKEARRCDQPAWIMRGLWLLAEAETQLEVMDSALKHFDQAIELAAAHGSKQEVRSLEAACQRALQLMKQREADRAKAKALYTTVGVIQPRRSIVGNVKFDEPDEPEEETPEMERAQRPHIVLSKSADDSGSVLDISDSFDDSGSYVDWTDEDTLPAEEPSQEQLAAAPDEEGAGEEGEDGSSGSGSSPRSSGEDDGEERPEDGQRTPVPSEAAGETEYKTAGGEETAPEDSAADGAGPVTAEEGGLVTAEEGGLVTAEDGEDAAGGVTADGEDEREATDDSGTDEDQTDAEEEQGRTAEADEAAETAEDDGETQAEEAGQTPAEQTSVTGEGGQTPAEQASVTGEGGQTPADQASVTGEGGQTPTDQASVTEETSGPEPAAAVEEGEGEGAEEGAE